MKTSVWKSDGDCNDAIMIPEGECNTVGTALISLLRALQLARNRSQIRINRMNFSKETYSNKPEPPLPINKKDLQNATALTA